MTTNECPGSAPGDLLGVALAAVSQVEVVELSLLGDGRILAP